MRDEVRKSIVSSARRNMRAHALAWREQLKWHDRAQCAFRLSRAMLWREVSQTIERQGLSAYVHGELPAKLALAA